MRPKICVLVALTCLVVVGWARPSDAEALTGISSVGTGYANGCAVLANGQVRCWGLNESGQLGNGTAVPGRFPATTVLAPRGTAGPLTGVRSVVGAEGHACALLHSGQVRCWGLNELGQLGDGTDAEERRRPVAVRNVAGTANLTGVVALTASRFTTCAVLSSGQARCWGNGYDGQLGAGRTVAWSNRPVVVAAAQGAGPLTGVSQIDAGDSTTCARLTSGQARCWGDGVDGVLGNGGDEPSLRPVVVRNAAGTGPLLGVRRVSVGAEHACAAIAGGTVRCWGDNDYSQLGSGGDSPVATLPVVVRNVANDGPLRGVAYVDAGTSHTCALLTDGGVRCWGEAEYGELGNGVHSPDQTVPVVVRNAGNNGDLGGVTQLQSTSYHTCVRLRNGQARCWGFGYFGNLGNSGDDDSALPVKVLRPA
jgi:alpha-tubulin suppressor-like RCC1 family protein